MHFRHWVYYYLARCYLMRKQHEEAARAYRLALAAHPRFALAAAGLGFLYATQERYAEAAAAFG